jgi:tetratricopeptide (TPR) repeat protein
MNHGGDQAASGGGRGRRRDGAPASGRLSSPDGQRAARTIGNWRASRSRNLRRGSLAWLAALLVPLAAPAHEDLLARIALLTERLRTNGPSADVTFQRAEIYRLHLDWDLALRDYDTAAAGFTNAAELDLGRGQALVGAGRFAEARAAFDRVVKLAPTNAPALLERARVLALLQQPALAIADYSRAIALQPSPHAVEFLERAQLQAALEGPAAALAGLEEGLARLGWTLTLQLLAMDYEVALGRHDAALARLETVIARSSRNENWLARKGEILRQAGRFAEARAALEAALAEIKRLPPRLLAAERTAALRAGIEKQLAALPATARNDSAAGGP